MRRTWITFLRVIRYGVSNFSRNAWLSTAATLVMVITLTIVLTTFTASLLFNDTIKEIREKIDVSIYLCDTQVPDCTIDVTQEQINGLETALKAVPIVTSIDFVTKEEAMQKYIDANKGELSQLQAIATLDGKNPFPAGLRVHVNDTNRLNEINDVVSQAQFKEMQARPASIAGTRKVVLERIASAAEFANIAGLVGSIVFVAISILIIFNTIRMTIFNRRDEIEIMKLIGAEKRFIRGPFIIEACLYGVIAALVSAALVYLGLVGFDNDLDKVGIIVGPTQMLFAHWPVVIILSQVAIGVAIGVLSSFLAMRRYLKI